MSGSKGQPVLNPLYQEARRLRSEVLALEERFGLNPLARLKLGVTVLERARWQHCCSMRERSQTPMSLTSKPLSAPAPLGDAPTDGPKVIKFIESHCRYGEGDNFGQPVRLDPWEKAIINHLYRLNPDGSRRYRRCLLELPKGNGKTPLGAWIAIYELCTGTSPVIPVAAASYEQSNLLFDDIRSAIDESPTLSQFLETFESEVQVRNGPGRAYRVAAVAGTNDGARPTLVLADEIHEWVGTAKERVFLVLSNGAASTPTLSPWLSRHRVPTRTRWPTSCMSAEWPSTTVRSMIRSSCSSTTAPMMASTLTTPRSLRPLYGPRTRLRSSGSMTSSGATDRCRNMSLSVTTWLGGCHRARCGCQ